MSTDTSIAKYESLFFKIDFRATYLSVLVGKKKSLLHFVGSILVSPVREPVL